MQMLLQSPSSWGFVPGSDAAAFLGHDYSSLCCAANGARHHAALPPFTISRGILFDLFERLHPNLARSRGGRFYEVCLALVGLASRHRESVSVGVLEGINLRCNDVHFTPQGTNLVCRQSAIVLQTGKHGLAQFAPLPFGQEETTQHYTRFVCRIWGFAGRFHLWLELRK